MDNNVIRIGLVVPPGNVAMERELACYLADGVVMNVNRLSRPTPAVTKESLLAMIDSVDQAVRDLAMCFPKPEIIIYGCTSGSFVSGPGKEAEIAERITKGVGIRAVTTSSAILMGLEAVHAKRVFLLTPYIKDVAAHEVALLEHYGYSIGGIDSFDCFDTRDIAKISTGQVEEMMLRHADEVRSCDAVLISCTQLLTMDRIDALEKALGKPVVTSNQASLWAALKLIGAPVSKSAPGSLFEGLRNH
ncbi:MAG: maleate cis-trans isomerase [Betaproteobacteria bacterium]